MVEGLFDKRCKNCRSTATFIHRGPALPRGVIKGLYCPICKSKIVFNPETMIETNDGWVIQYAMRSGAKILDTLDVDGHHFPESAYLSDKHYAIVSFILYPAKKSSDHQIMKIGRLEN